jgi:chemotaxis protein CheD
MTSSVLTNAAVRMIGMGQIATARHPPATLTTVLGSCVGLALYHPRLRCGGLAHIVLSKSNGLPNNPGKFADTAIPAMLIELETVGALRSGIVAKIAGGACMFGAGGPLQIGDANVEAVIQLLAAAGIRIIAREVGGNKGRKVSFDTESGAYRVELIGQPPIVL